MSQRKAGTKPETKRSLSIVVPTYNETDNIRELAARLGKATEAAGIDAELLIVDDESPGSEETAKIVKELAGSSMPVRIHCRKSSEGRGLSSAVLLGFRMASHSTLLCMDADLQHEPESVPAVAAPVLDGEAEFSVGSRHTAGGGTGFDWALSRVIMSKVATMLAWPVASASDPMSGFFCVTKEVLKRGEPNINPIGFKIGLEIMARCRCKPVKDVPIIFQPRAAGESKMSGKQIYQYVQQLFSLYEERVHDHLALVFVAFLFHVLVFIYMTYELLS